jgi:hypothetical protein
MRTVWLNVDVSSGDKVGYACEVGLKKCRAEIAS